MPDPRTQGGSAERARSPIWQWPVVAAAVAVGAAVVAGTVRPASGALLASLPAGDHDSARALLQVTATSVMTATTITFTLTLVTLQLASQQFSPRLLREFTRDPTTKAVLSVLAATFAFATTGLVLLDADHPVPRVTVLATCVLALASLGAILTFVSHIVRTVRVDTMMLVVHDETSTAIATFYPAHGDEPRPRVEDLGLDVEPGTDVPADESGFVQRTDVAGLVRAARAHGALVRMDVRAGDHVVRGTPMATLWPDGQRAHGRGTDDEHDNDLEALARSVREAVTVGYERSLDQDAAFGFRQLEDIAVKAVSPSINDPVTAAHAVGHMADLLVRLMGCRLGPTVHTDDDGAPRAVVPDRDLRYYLDLACGQLRRFGSDEPTVLAALLRMLRDAGLACRDDDQRAEVRRAAELVLAEAEGRRDPDRGELEDLAARVEHALAGRRTEAYGDRAGETRSM